MVSKKLIKQCVESYITDGLSPSDQPQQRDARYFDICGMVKESYEWLKLSAKELSESEVMTIMRHIIRQAESHANIFKRAKIIEEDIACAFKTYILPT